MLSSNLRLGRHSCSYFNRIFYSHCPTSAMAAQSNEADAANAQRAKGLPQMCTWPKSSKKCACISCHEEAHVMFGSVLSGVDKEPILRGENYNLNTDISYLQHRMLEGILWQLDKAESIAAFQSFCVGDPRSTCQSSRKGIGFLSVRS